MLRGNRANNLLRATCTWNSLGELWQRNSGQQLAQSNLHRELAWRTLSEEPTPTTCTEQLAQRTCLENFVRGTRANNLLRATCTENLLGELPAAANAFGRFVVGLVRISITFSRGAEGSSDECPRCGTCWKLGFVVFLKIRVL